MIAYYHREITRSALAARISQDTFITIIRANLSLDNFSGITGHPEYHYDNNAFSAGKAFIEQQRSIIFSAMETPEGIEKGRKAFGRLSHTSQDFYAHSNFVALWTYLHPEMNAEEIDPLDEKVLNNVQLHSGTVYLPWEILAYVPFFGRYFKSFLPRNSHTWMNLDSPASGALFDFARAAARKRTIIEFDKTIDGLNSRGGNLSAKSFTGMADRR